jgi:hypothetical protein
VKLVLAQHPGVDELVGRLALVVLRIRLDPEFGRQPEHPFMRVADPLGAEFDRHPGHHLLSEYPPTDPFVGLQDQRHESSPEQLSCRDLAGESRSDDDDVRFHGRWLHHRPTFSQCFALS